jgi:5-formyltetrahydrofolate cyclo-ligase
MNEKTDLRKAAELRRQTLARPDHAAALAAHADALALPQGVVVAGYWPMKSEADPRALMAVLAAKGHPLALPCVAKRGAPLLFHRWKDGDPLTKGAFGTSEPLLCAERVTPCVLLVPLLAFDAEGYRLGYGGGFYDRTLETLRAARDILAIGIAYAGQEVSSVPHGAHDQRLDAVFTENGLCRFHHAA